MIQHKMILAETIVDKVIQEMCDRCGFDDWWYNIDPDIRESIKVDLCWVVHQSIGKHEEENENN